MFFFIFDLFKNFSSNFDEDIYCLVFVFVTFVANFGSVAGSFITSVSAAGSGVVSRVKILCNFFIGNNRLLKLLRTFSLALNSNPMLFKIFFFQMLFYLFQIFLIQ